MKRLARVVTAIDAVLATDLLAIAASLGVAAVMALLGR